MIEKELSIIQKIEKGRAEFAYKCVKDAIGKLDGKKKREYRSYIKKIPSMILSNGAGQTLAFIKSKSKKGNAYEFLYEQIQKYFKNKEIPRITMPVGKNDMLDWIVSCDSKTEYRYITTELLALFSWLKRFAEGMIEGEENE